MHVVCVGVYVVGASDALATAEHACQLAARNTNDSILDSLSFVTKQWKYCTKKALTLLCAVLTASMACSNASAVQYSAAAMHIWSSMC
jgi:hypothetical protein